MHVGYVCSDFGVPVFGFKGCSIHVREMIEALRRAGHEVSLFSPAIDMDERDGENRFDPDPSLLPVNLHPVAADGRHLELFRDFEKLDKFLGQKTRIRQEVRNLFYNMTLYDAAYAALREKPIDFVYERYTLLSASGTSLARDLGVPHLLEVNAPLAYEQEKMRGLEMKELAKGLESRIFGEADRLLVVSDALKEFAVSRGVAEDRIHVIPNSVDPTRFRISGAERDAMRVRLSVEDRCVIGFVGGLKPWHGTETLLQAFAALRKRVDDTHILIVGDGPARDELEGYVDEQNMRGDVIFTGKVPYREIPHYLAAMDVVVAPYTPNENFYFSPIKIFEYMMAGKPTVAGSIGQVADVILDRENGRLYEPGNVAELADVLQDLVRNPSVRDSMGSAGRTWVESVRTWDHNAAELIEIAATL